MTPRRRLLVAVLLAAAQLGAWAQEAQPEAPACGCEAGEIPLALLPAPEPDTEAGPPVDIEVEAIDRGIASWYGPRFHGRRTASGERFDMDAFTAAHRSLPFGTRVRVESPADGRSVEVRINDRGPHIKRRVIDLSRAAARALGLLDPGGGLKPVIVRIVKAPLP
jgi:rare lipoprotein A